MATLHDIDLNWLITNPQIITRLCLSIQIVYDNNNKQNWNPNKSKLQSYFHSFNSKIEVWNKGNKGQKSDQIRQKLNCTHIHKAHTFLLDFSSWEKKARDRKKK